MEINIDNKSTIYLEDCDKKLQDITKYLVSRENIVNICGYKVYVVRKGIKTEINILDNKYLIVKTEKDKTKYKKCIKQMELNSKSSDIIMYVICKDKETYDSYLGICSKYNWIKLIIRESNRTPYFKDNYEYLLSIKKEWKYKKMVGICRSNIFKCINLDIFANDILTDNKKYIQLDRGDEINGHHVCPHMNELWFNLLDELKLPNTTINKYWLTTPHKMKSFIKWYINTCIPTILTNKYVQKYDCQEKVLKLIMKSYLEHMTDIYYDETYFDMYYKYDIYNTHNLTNIKSIDNSVDIKPSHNLKESDRLVTSHYDKVKFAPELIDYNYIDNIDQFILIVDFPNFGGGTTFFINSIVSHYKLRNIFIIARNYNDNIVFTINDEYELNKKYNIDEANAFLDKYRDKINKIFINHTIGHDIKFLSKLFELQKEITTITHDFYNINIASNPCIHKISNTYNDNSKLSINNYTQIITQNVNNMYIFDKHITNKHIPIIVSPLPDFKNKKDMVYSNNKHIVIGIFGYISPIKGLHILNNIYNYYITLSIKIKFVVFGTCDIKDIEQYVYHNIDELNTLLIKHKPNVLLELSICAETYSYTLSLAMITDLPIIYFRKTGNFTVEDRLSKYGKSYAFRTINELNELVHRQKQNWFYTIEPIIYFNSFWDEYFNCIDTKMTLDDNIVYKNGINIYPIYFPQFHMIEENNISFYNGYTDIINLHKLHDETISYPNLDIYNMKQISDYDLTNIHIVQKQIDIITKYNFNGFAIYYYWFSINSITNKHMIMEKVIDMFFNDSISMNNRKVFLIWANESWTNNPAFASMSHKMENIYDDNSIALNVQNIIKYFKHNNYLKINNKPIFMIYHSWMMTKIELNNFKQCLDIECKKNSFDGVYFILNSMANYDEIISYGYDTFNLHFNYKNPMNISNVKGINIIDYKKYVDNIILNNGIDTLVFDFNNTVRLSCPNKLNLVTICKNNNKFENIRLIKKICDKYEICKDLQHKIMLINAWNEWGEKMTIEPSNEYGFYYLNLIKNVISFR